METLILAIVIGAAFGFTLDRVGATNPNFIIGMLRLSNMHLMKTILLAVAVATLLLFGGLMLGLLDAGNLGVKDAYVGVIVGGVLLGAGFAISGFCPGTGLTAAATGRKDALWFVLGGLIGAAAYMLTFAAVESTGLLDPIAGGKATLGTVAGTSYPALWPDLPGEWVGLALAVVLGAVAFVLPMRLRGSAGTGR
jgi:hypothetical protein